MTEPVPSWVHMADVPPPTDEEPWTPREDPARPMRDWSRVATVIAIVGLLVLVTIAWWER